MSPELLFSAATPVATILWSLSRDALGLRKADSELGCQDEIPISLLHKMNPVKDQVDIHGFTFRDHQIDRSEHPAISGQLDVSAILTGEVTDEQQARLAYLESDLSILSRRDLS
jgi:hypothetical protein